MIPFELSTGESALVRGGFFRRSRENKGKTNMKQLKFMLAAATAISLATAAQAAVADEKLSDEKFNSYNEGQAVIGSDGAALIDGFSYTGTAGDNESTIIKESEGDMALKVNTGTDPLLRMIDTKNRQDVNLSATGFNYLNIDTMVQFTVTPETDTVLPGLTNPNLKDEDGNVVLEGNIKEDKLLIYLQEKTVGETKSNVLTVWASEVQSGGDDDFGAGEDKFVPTKVEIPGVEVVPNQWYRLQVKTYVENGIVLFSIKLGDTELASSVALYSSATQGTKAFPSLLGKATTLTYVGFAGEGMVDDLVVTKNYDVSALDFTFTWSGDGITGVTYTIGEDTYEVTSGTAFQVQPGTSFTVNVALADWYKLAKTSYVYNNVTEGDTVEIPSAEKVITTEPAADGTVTVNPSATKEELAAVKTEAGITDGAFKDSGAEELGKALTWMNKNSVSVESVNAVEFATTNIIENGVEKQVFVANNEAAEAYLLNCNPNSTVEGQTLQDYKDNFKFDAEDLASLFNLENVTTEALQNTLFSDKGYNGSIILEGTESLGGTWEVRKNGHKFFRARLVK